MSTSKKNVQALVQECSDLQKQYAFATRTVITPHRYHRLVVSGLLSAKDYDNPALTEPLIEHVGQLPILAAFWHPHIAHSAEVDLGRVLAMLAIHDIGETVTGDVNSYHKTEQQGIDEHAAALRVLHPSQHALYEEFESRETLEAKFAKSLDGFAVEIFVLNLPKVTIDNAAKLSFTEADVIAKKRPLMEWDSVMLEAFDLMMQHFTAVRVGNEPLFKVEPYDQW